MLQSPAQSIELQGGEFVAAKLPDCGERRETLGCYHRCSVMLVICGLK